MTSMSTTIRVRIEQRDRLRRLAEESDATMTDTPDAAIESQRCQRFYEAMVTAEAQLRRDPVAWDAYVRDRDAWLNPDLATT